MITLDTNTIAADLQAVVNQLSDALDEAALIAVDEMATTARDQMQDLYAAESHNVLASLWTYDVMSNGDGAEAEVFSLAERMTFYAKTGLPPTRAASTLYPLGGDRLLAILEGGARPHGIDAGTVNPEAKYLVFPGYKQKHVDHPGVQASGDIDATAERMLSVLDDIADFAAQHVEEQFA